MKKITCLLAFVAAVYTASGQNAPFSDIGFENMPLGAASSTAWVFEYSIPNSQFNPVCQPLLTTYSLGNTTSSVITTPLADPSGLVINKSPFSGNKVMVINHPGVVVSSGGRLSQTFLVTPTNFMFRYAYQSVMDNGSSPCDGGCLQFKFYSCNNVLIGSMSKTVVPTTGGINADVAQWQLGSLPNISGFPMNVSYTPGWVLHTANLSAYVGSCIRVEACWQSCICGGKMGYGYYDCESSASIIEAETHALSRGVGSFTSCNSTTTLQAAEGFSTYSWQGPVGSGVSGSTNSLVTTTVPGSYTLSVTNGTFTANEVFNLAIGSAPANLSVSASNSITCAGTTVTLQATSQGLNSYSWQGGTYTTAAIAVTPTSNANMYDVVATNSLGCSINAQQWVYLVPSPTLQVVGPANVCPGQSVALTVTGNAMTSYSWSNGSNQMTAVISPTTSTYYTVVGTNSNNCTAWASKLISPFTPLPVQITGNAFVCPGQALVLSVNDPSIPTYTWTSGLANQSNTVFPIANTFYLVYATDVNGCSTSGMKSITVYPLPQIQITPINPSVCFGQPVSLSASTTGNGILWNTGSTNATITDTPGISGTYVAAATDGNNCTATASVMVTVNSLPQINIQSDGDEVCDGATMLLNAYNSGYIIYNWSNGDSNPSTTISPTILTVYTLTVTDANGCSNSTQKTINVQECTGIEAYSAANVSLQVFPNPTADSFTIKSTGNVQGYIVNALGQVVSQVSLTPQNNFTQSLNGLAKGVYTIKTKARSVKVAVQ